MNILQINDRIFKLADNVLFNEQKHGEEEFGEHYAKCVETLIQVNGDEKDESKAKAMLRELNDINKKHKQIINLPAKNS